MAGVETTRDGAVLTIRLARPGASNALDARMHADLEAALERARDPEVRAVVLTGESDVFCSGHDPAELERKPYELSATPAERLGRHVLALRSLEKPVLAAVNGAAVGAGVALALACDIRLAAENASFEPGFAAAGLAPEGGTGWLLRRSLGGARAFEWLVTGHRITATEALEQGLVSELVPAGKLAERVAEVARVFAAMPTRAVWETKRLLDAAETSTLADQLGREAFAQADLLRSPDAAEAAAADREGREPRFGGAPPEAEHPIRLAVRDDLRRWRLTVLLRWVLVVPHALVATGWVYLAQVVVIAAWFAALVRGRVPDGLHAWLGRALRYSVHVTAYASLVADPFPGFRGWPGTYPVDLELAPPARQSRWTIAFRLVLAVPALVLSGVLSWIHWLVALVAWFAALALGRVPRGMRDLMAYCLRYQAQTYGYVLLLTSRYPSLASGSGFQFEEGPDVRDERHAPDLRDVSR